MRLSRHKHFSSQLLIFHINHVCLCSQFRYAKSILNSFSLKLPKTEARETVTQGFSTTRKADGCYVGSSKMFLFP